MRIANPSALFEENPAARRKLVLRLYGLVGPVFTLVLFVEARAKAKVPATALVSVFIILPALLLLSRPIPATLDWMLSAAISPTLCCGVAFVATGNSGPAYIGVLGAPLAWCAVLFDARVIRTALIVAGATCFAALVTLVGVSHAIINTIIFETIFGLVAWVVFAQASALRSARKELQLALARDRAILAALPDTVATLNGEGRLLHVHSSNNNFLPLPPALLIGRTCFDFLPSEVHDPARAAIGRALRGESVEGFEYTVGYGAELRTFESRLVQSAPGEVLVVRRDVTELREGQDQLRRSELRYRALFENLRESVTVFDVVRDEYGGVTDWVLRESNALARASIGARYASSIGHPISELLRKDEVQPLISASAEILAGHSQLHESIFTEPGRHYRSVAFSIAPDTIVSAAVDITDRVASENMLRLSLAENGEMLASLRDALAKVRSLSGLLPICMYCKKIRDDEGYWEQVETYITKHSEALFSHGMCPDCAATFLATNFPGDE